MTCDHVWFEHAEGGFCCPDCGLHDRREQRMVWSEGRAPGMRADIKPHFNHSIGRPITSRAQMAEVCKEEGVTPINPDIVASQDATDAEVKACNKRLSDAIHNPKTDLKEAYYEDEIAAPIGQDL